MEPIYNKNGGLKKKEKLEVFQGNVLFASDSMINMNSTSRKDELESLILMLCFLLKGKLPVSEFMQQNIEKVQLADFLNQMIKFRVEKQKRNYDEVCAMLPSQMKNALEYLTRSLWEHRPNYDQIRLQL